MLFTRYVFVARKEIIEASALIRVARVRIPSSWDKDIAMKHETIREAIEGLLRSAENYLPARIREGMLAWSGSRQIASSILIHEAERQSTWLMAHDLVVARLIQIGGQLSSIPEARRSEWRRAYGAFIFENRSNGKPSPEQMTRDRLFLSEFLAEKYAAQDASSTRLYDLYNKTFWLIIISLVPMAVLVGLGYALVLAAGAIGGIISRMQRVVFAKQLPTSFGTSWNPLFCAPILGALAAWSGLALLRLFQILGIVSLSHILPSDNAVTNPTLPVLGLAVLFGLSERFLNTLGDQAQAALNVSGSTSVPNTEVVPVPPLPGPAAAGSDSDRSIT
jgi:hypothetical protein